MFDNSHGSDAMHDIIKKRNRKNAIITLTVIILSAIFRVFLTRFYIYPDIHFYTRAYARFFDYAVAAGIAFLYISSVFLYRYKKDEHTYSAAAACFVQGTQTQVFTASVAGFLLAASAVLQVWSFAANFDQYANAGIQSNMFDIFIFFAAVLSSVYFFRTAALDQDKSAAETEYSQRYIIISLMPVLWSSLNTFKCFFDMSRSVNSPVKIYELMCFVALSLYFVSETRMLAGRLGIAKFFTFAYIAIVITALSALPNLILSSFWIMQINDTQIMYAIQLAFTLYIAARIYSQIRYGRFLLQGEKY